MQEITVVELRNHLRAVLDGVYFRARPLVVQRYEALQVVLVRRDRYERLERECQAALRARAKWPGPRDRNQPAASHRPDFGPT